MAAEAHPKNSSWPLKRSPWITGGMILLIAAVYGVLHAQRGGARSTAGPARTVPSVPVAVAQARRGDIGVYLTGLGAVTPLNTITVKTRIDGQLETVSYREGQRVRKGDPLVEIDPRPYEAQLAQAEAQLERDQAALEN